MPEDESSQTPPQNTPEYRAYVPSTASATRDQLVKGDKVFYTPVIGTTVQAVVKHSRMSTSSPPRFEYQLEDTAGALIEGGKHVDEHLPNMDAHVLADELEKGEFGTVSTATTANGSDFSAVQPASAFVVVSPQPDSTRHDENLRKIPAARWCLGKKDKAAEGDRTIVRQLKTFPRGYPNLAAFTDSDENFMIYRRFGYLQARILLDKQNEMASLEAELDALDKSEMFTEPDRLFKYDLDESEVCHRRKLMAKVESKYVEYSRILTAASQMVGLNRPAPDEYQSVFNYLHNKPRIYREERKYIYHKDDLVTLRHGREHAWLDTAIERCLKSSHCKLLEWLFCSSEDVKRGESSEPSGEADAVYYSRERIALCATVILTVVILTLLVVPVYLLLRHVNGIKGPLPRHTVAICMAILLLFTLAFSAMLSSFTSAKRHEILGAAAAYCAVLVVFFGNST